MELHSFNRVVSMTQRHDHTARRPRRDFELGRQRLLDDRQ
jgi:hypothetical protein